MFQESAQVPLIRAPPARGARRPVACNWTGNMPETRHCAISCGTYSTDGKKCGVPVTVTHDRPSASNPRSPERRFNGKCHKPKVTWFMVIP